MKLITTSLLVIVFIGTSKLFAQVTTVPEEPDADQVLTITLDVTGTGLEGYTEDVWLWIWIEKASGDIGAPTDVNPATDAESDALMTRSSTNADIYSITITLTDFLENQQRILTRLGFY